MHRSVVAPLRRDIIAVWRIKEQGQGWGSQVVHVTAPPLPEGPSRLTCLGCSDSPSGLLIAAGVPPHPFHVSPAPYLHRNGMLVTTLRR